MGKPKAKRAKVEVIDFTDAKRQALGFGQVAVTDKGQVIGVTPKRRCPAYAWTWLGDAERASLIRYADLAELAEVTVKGCLSPVGGGESLVGAERRMMRRDEFAWARMAANECHEALAFTERALLGDQPQSFDELCIQFFAGTRQTARDTGKRFVGIVARNLVRYFGA